MTKTCANPACGKPYTTRFRKTRHCSRECGAWRRRRKVKTCANAKCAKSFTGRRNQRYCSKPCRNALNKKRKDRQCQWCWEWFYPRTADRECCSQHCAASLRHRRKPKGRDWIAKAHEALRKKRVKRYAEELRGCKTLLDAFKAGKRFGYSTGYQAGVRELKKARRIGKAA